MPLPRRLQSSTQYVLTIIAATLYQPECVCGLSKFKPLCCTHYTDPEHLKALMSAIIAFKQCKPGPEQPGIILGFSLN